MFQYARQYLIDHSQYAPNVLKDIPPDRKFPLVVIKKEGPYLKDETLKRREKKMKLIYDIEIYAINQKTEPRQVIVEELRELLIDVFFDHYGMDISLSIPEPNADENVARWSLVFKGLIDENKRIYRR